MSKKRIQVYTDEETKRRIELAAAKFDVPVTEYCLTAIRQQLAEDDLLKREKIEISVSAKTVEKHTTHLRALQKEIKESRGGKLIDVDSLIEQVREEREHEILGLR